MRTSSRLWQGLATKGSITWLHGQVIKTLPETSKHFSTMRSSYREKLKQKFKVAPESKAHQTQAQPGMFFWSVRDNLIITLLESAYSRLPQEILDILVEEFRNDTPTLLRLSLVSTGLLIACRRHLFRKLTLCVERIQKLRIFRLAEAPQCTFGRHVQDLELCSWSMLGPYPSSCLPGIFERRFNSDVGKIPQLFPNVRTLFLKNFPIHRMPRKSQRDFCGGFENVETLIIKRRFEDTPHSFVEFVCSLPNIRNVHCKLGGFYWESRQIIRGSNRGIREKPSAGDLPVTKLELTEPSNFCLFSLTKSPTFRNVQSISIRIIYPSSLDKIGGFLKEIGPNLSRLQLNLDRAESNLKGEELVALNECIRQLKMLV